MTTQKREMTRAGLAKVTNVNLETIRYYEKIGVLKEPQRTLAGHRRYEEEDVKRLNFVRRSRELGYTLGEVRNLLELVDNNTYTCDQVRELTLGHLDEVNSKIKDLRKIAKSLATMARQCDGGTTPECPVIDVLYH